MTLRSNREVVERASRRRPRKSDDTVYVCRCECGGQVRGQFCFGRLFSWCESCTPVVEVKVPATGTLRGR